MQSRLCCSIAAKLFITKPRIESKWYHENQNFNVLFTDVASTPDKYVKAALYCLKPTPKETPAKANWTKTEEEENLYSIDIASSDVPRTQLEVSQLFIASNWSF